MVTADKFLIRYSIVQQTHTIHTHREGNIESLINLMCIELWDEIRVGISK